MHLPAASIWHLCSAVDGCPQSTGVIGAEAGPETTGGRGLLQPVNGCSPQRSKQIIHPTLSQRCHRGRGGTAGGEYGLQALGQPSISSQIRDHNSWGLKSEGGQRIQDGRCKPHNAAAAT